MTKGIIQKEFDIVLDMLDIEGSEGVYDLVMELQIKLIERIKNQAHWMYPKYTNGRHDFISLTAYELVGDLDK